MSFSYHTYREIRQQPQVWQAAYDLLLARKDEIYAFIAKCLSEGYRVVLTGAGTSAYIGDALEPALNDSLFKGARSVATTDILTAPSNYFSPGDKVLLVSFARSGNSPESVGAVKAVEATAGSVAHIFITCNAEGQLAQMKGPRILTLLLPPETNDVSLAMTSSYSTMLITCAIIAHINRIEEQKEYISAISGCVQAAMDKYESQIQAMAAHNFKRAVFLGSGPLKGVAEESRLKLQELTDGAVMCAFDSFLGFRHGPKAVVNEETLMVYLLAPDAAVQRYELDLIRQIKAGIAIDSSILICSRRPESLEADACDLTIETGLPEGLPKCYVCVSYIFVAQLLGCFKSIDCGLSPDAPSVSGKISRVVEGVTLYI